MTTRPDLAPEAIAHRIELRSNTYGSMESPICDLRWLTVVAESYFDETISECKLLKHDGYKTVLLTNDQWNAVHFILGEIGTKVRELYRIYYRDDHEEGGP